MSRTVCPEFTDAYIERVLRLQQGSIAEGLGNDLALNQLVKIIRLFPWVLEVADQNFDEIYAKKIIVREVANHTMKELGKLQLKMAAKAQHG